MADAPTYPKRPPFFACKFVRLMTKKCVANDLGPQVFTLLAVIAHQEDARGYSDPVGWFNTQLLPVVGIKSVDVLDRVRDKAVKAGWLHYIPGTKSEPGWYFVTIPERFKRTDDGPTDEGVEGEFGGDSFRTGAEESAEQTPVSGRTLRTGAEESRRDQRTEPDRNSGTLIPVPSPVPVAASKSDAAPSSTGQPEQKSVPGPAAGSDPPPKTRREKSREKKPWKPNPLFDAVVAATGADVKLDGSYVGRAAAALAEALPPVAPAEVADFAANWRRALPWAKPDEHPHLTPGILVKHMTTFRQWRRFNPPRAPARGTAGPIEFDRLPPGG